MMRPSCSVIEQKVQPPKQPRMDRRPRTGSSRTRGSSRRRSPDAARARTAARRCASISVRRQRDRRRVEPDVAVAVPLHQRARVAGVRSRGAGCARRARRAPGRSPPARRRHADDAARAVDARHAAVNLTSAPVLRRRRPAAASRSAPSRTDRSADRAAGRVDVVESISIQPRAATPRERGAAQVGDVASIASPAARRCAISTICALGVAVDAAGRPWRRAAPSGAPSPTSSRSARCGAALPRCRRSRSARR